MIILLPALLCIYFAIRMGVNLYGNLRFPCIYLSNHREILTTYHYDSPLEISRSTNYISDYIVYTLDKKFLHTFFQFSFQACQYHKYNTYNYILV